jgi:hypothetical protein
MRRLGSARSKTNEAENEADSNHQQPASWPHRFLPFPNGEPALPSYVVDEGGFGSSRRKLRSWIGSCTGDALTSSLWRVHLA